MESRGLIETTLQIQSSIGKKYEKHVCKNNSLSYDDMVAWIGTRSYKQLEIGKFLLSMENREISLKQLMERTNSSLSTVKELYKRDNRHMKRKYTGHLLKNIFPL